MGDDAEPPTDRSGTLAHADDAPVTASVLPEKIGPDTAASIRHADSKLECLIDNVYAYQICA